MEELSISINNVWVLVATFLIMFMQPGFAMVEAGFTRSKNSTNILTKNLVDFSLGAILFWVIGYTIMFGEDIGDRPLLMLGVLMIVVSIQFFTTGIMSEMMTRTYYESSDTKPYVLSVRSTQAEEEIRWKESV